MNQTHARNFAFTLIELLIVVAIIGILAAIAVPNFLNAQTRAKVARTQSDLRTIVQATDILHLDQNIWLIDGNDCNGTKECCFEGPYFGKTAIDANVRLVAGQGTFRFNGQIYRPLTTPIAYMSSIPTDPFANGLFYSYEDYGCSNTPGSEWGLLAAAGPDNDSGDWHRSQGPTPYAPSNGVSSNGDLWYAFQFREVDNATIWETYYHPGFSFQ
jgi:prepilin-type N-terminal cleavage/methylation domain-containing protein